MDIVVIVIRKNKKVYFFANLNTVVFILRIYFTLLVNEQIKTHSKS